MSSIPSVDRAIIDREMKSFYGVRSIPHPPEYSGMANVFLVHLTKIGIQYDENGVIAAARAELDARGVPEEFMDHAHQAIRMYNAGRRALQPYFFEDNPGIIGSWMRFRTWVWSHLKWFTTRAERARRLRVERALKRFRDNQPSAQAAMSNRDSEALREHQLEQARQKQNVGMQSCPGAAAAKVEFGSAGPKLAGVDLGDPGSDKTVCEVFQSDLKALDKWAKGCVFNPPVIDQTVTREAIIPFSTNHTPPAAGEPIDLDRINQDFVDHVSQEEKRAALVEASEPKVGDNILFCTKLERMSPAELLWHIRNPAGANKEFIRLARLECARRGLSVPSIHIPFDDREKLMWRDEISKTSTDVLRSNVNTGDVTHPEYMQMAQEELARRDAAPLAIQTPAPDKTEPVKQDINLLTPEEHGQVLYSYGSPEDPDITMNPALWPDSFLKLMFDKRESITEELCVKVENEVHRREHVLRKLATHGSEPLKTAPENVDPELLDTAQVEALKDGTGVMLAVGGSEYFYPYVIFTESLSGKKHVKVLSTPSFVVLQMQITGCIRYVGKSINHTRVKIAKP